MADENWQEDCAPRRILALFATKWTSMILQVLHTVHSGSARTGILQRSVPGISKKMLSRTLRDMVASGLIERRVLNIMPPAVNYEITSLGQRFIEPIEWLHRWGRDNADALDALNLEPGSRRRSR